MSEQYGSYENNNDRPCLFNFEIRAMANLAIIEGGIREANHDDIQPTDKPQPHFFRITIPPDEIDSQWRLRPSDDSEFIRGITIEYNEPMIITDDEVAMDPWVTVTVESNVYDARLSAFVDKMVRYRLSLVEGGVCEAIEERSDTPTRTNISTYTEFEAVQALSEEARPLTDDDLQFLRLLISRR